MVKESSDSGVELEQAAESVATANGRASKLIWFDQSGKELGQIAEAGYSEPRLSPDGRFLAVSSDDARNGKLFVRVYDLERGVATRLTDGVSDESPVWSHDGRKLAYGSSDGRAHYVNVVSADHSSPPQHLLKGDAIMRHLDWSPDGHLVFMDLSNGTSLKVYPAADKQAAPFGLGAEARFSPDGKWIAYIAGIAGIVVQPFPGPGGRIEISSGSGAQPVWARDGRKIFS